MAQADSQLLTQSSDGAQPRLDILHKSDYASERERIPRWTPGSCKWILQQEQYRSWIQDKKSSFLWLSGGRGCGKTVLASFLVEELKSQNSQSSLPGTVCCLFFNANNKDYKNPSTALCTLLHQLLNHKDQAIRESLWNKYIAPEFREQDQAFTTQLAVLWRILALVLSDPDCGNVMCVVDGLSDCGEDRIPFINSIARLFEEHDPNGEKHGKNHGFLKIIAMTQFPINSSSSHRRLETADMRWLQLPPTDDVSLFIDARTKDMRSFSRIPKEKRTKFAHDLLEVAKNTFLLAALILDWLEDVEEYDRVFERLEDLKSCDQDKHQSDVDNTISSIYEMSLKDCPDNHMTRKLFRLTVGAFEPLTLEEINVAMAVPCGTDIGGNELEQISEPVIKKSCGILLRVVYNRVIFRHRTAREFLTNQVQSKMDESNTWKHQLNPTESNSLLAEICVTYLLNPNVSKSNREAATSNVEAGVQDYPSNNRFLDYASKNWAEHFTVAKEPEQLVKNVVSLCDPVSEHFNTWFYNYWKSLHHSNSRLKGINNLMVASHLGHLSVIRWLKTQKDKINIAATDKNGWTALHWASQWENLEIAEELLDLGADIDAESEKKRTPLDFAAAKGYETLVQLFLSHKSAKPTSVVDKNSNVLVSAPPLSTSQERKIARSSAYIGKDGVRSLMLFEATQEGNEALVKTLLERGTRTNQLHSNGLTALHVAASQNYPSIVLLLLEKGRADFDKMTHDGKTALVLASEKGHENIVEILLKFGANTDIGGYTPYSSANENIKSLLGRRRIVEGPSLTPRSPSPPPLLLQRKDKSHSSHDFHATLLDLWADGTPLHEARSPFVHPTVHDVLYGDGPNNIMAQDGEDLRNKRTFRWIHLPANNMVWVKDLMTRIYRERMDESRSISASEYSAKLKNIDRLLDKSQQYRAPKDSAIHARFFRPSCRSVNIGEYSITSFNGVSSDSQSREDKKAESKKGESGNDHTASGDNDIVLFMPFLHYETNGGRKSLATAIENATKSRLERKFHNGGEKSTPDEKLIQTYLHEKHCMHIRRTLDQYYYHTMKDTSARDEDQVVYRYAKKMWPEVKESDLNILMVDQLWLWILGGDTVITSFPRRWDRRQSEDDLDVVDSIRKHINLREGRDPLRSAYDLAVLIASFCSEIFFEREDAPEPLSEKLQFFEFFDKSIGDVTANETACFDRLANFFKDLDKKSRENEGYFIEAIEKEVEDDRIEGPTALNTDKPYDVFYNIGEEAALLREIKDIRDELNIITKVFTNQQKALEIMNKLVENKVKMNGKEPSADIIKRIKRHVNDVKEIDDHASRAYEALNHLLDLKQKHANVCEARWTREQAQETAKQSNTIMVFTIVTIIFLPLSFMASFFALEIVQFPKDPATGNQALELNYVAKYLLGISAAISVPFLVIAFNVNRISFWVQENLSPLQETSFVIWFLDRLGWLSQNKKDQLKRKRKNRLKKQSERKGKKSSFQKPDSSANPPAEEKSPPAEEKSDWIPIGITFRDSNFIKNRIFSTNSMANRRKPNDEENQNLTPKPEKARTYPLFQTSQKNREFKP